MVRAGQHDGLSSRRSLVDPGGESRQAVAHSGVAGFPLEGIRQLASPDASVRVAALGALYTHDHRYTGDRPAGVAARAAKEHMYVKTAVAEIEDVVQGIWERLIRTVLQRPLVVEGGDDGHFMAILRRTAYWAARDWARKKGFRSDKPLRRLKELEDAETDPHRRAWFREMVALEEAGSGWDDTSELAERLGATQETAERFVREVDRLMPMRSLGAREIFIDDLPPGKGPENSPEETSGTPSAASMTVSGDLRARILARAKAIFSDGTDHQNRRKALRSNLVAMALVESALADGFRHGLAFDHEAIVTWLEARGRAAALPRCGKHRRDLHRRDCKQCKDALSTMTKRVKLALGRDPEIQDLWKDVSQS